ncbi:BadF/BadG/BcrA/BcrD ATPase family protein [Massilia sp. W12]|uniref:BadF/BadG/BcrA/BcrD ATPase family protein n=1 Tax=Massilia sp. W12 TaxID=3126507 RepID=UPI0030CC944C
MKNFAEYVIGVDGGGSGTRVRVETIDGQEVARGVAGPSGLMHGISQAWHAVLDALNNAFAESGRARPPLQELAIGLGLAGVHNKQWAAKFTAKNPGFAAMALETDAFTTLLGAHGGAPGAIIAIGTGSVGEALLPHGVRREVGGWGFPSSDEASGAWLGMRAVQYAQHALDGRAANTQFARAVLEFCGGERDALFDWLARATQTNYAQLAPLVIEYAGSDAAALAFMQAAGQEVAKIAAALDPAGTVPIALCGGLAAPLTEYLPETLKARLRAPQGDAAAGALELIRQHMKHKALA